MRLKLEPGTVSVEDNSIVVDKNTVCLKIGDGIFIEKYTLDTGQEVCISSDIPQLESIIIQQEGKVGIFSLNPCNSKSPFPIGSCRCGDSFVYRATGGCNWEGSYITPTIYLKIDIVEIKDTEIIFDISTI